MIKPSSVKHSLLLAIKIISDHISELYLTLIHSATLGLSPAFLSSIVQSFGGGNNCDMKVRLAHALVDAASAYFGSHFTCSRFFRFVYLTRMLKCLVNKLGNLIAKQCCVGKPSGALWHLRKKTENTLKRCLQETMSDMNVLCIKLNEPRCEKTGLRGFRPGPTQTRLCNHTKWLEA